jgi:hypothetical protein
MLLKTCLKYLAVFLSESTLLPHISLFKLTRVIESDALDIAHHGEDLRVTLVVQRRFSISPGLDPPTSEDFNALLDLHTNVNSMLIISFFEQGLSVKEVPNFLG